MGEITSLIKQRLSIYNIFMLYDDIEMGKMKVNADFHLQNKKIEFLFKILNEKDTVLLQN